MTTEQINRVKTVSEYFIWMRVMYVDSCTKSEELHAFYSPGTVKNTPLACNQRSLFTTEKENIKTSTRRSSKLFTSV